MEQRRALVTGCCGEMGRLLVPLLDLRGYRPLAVDLQPAPPGLAGPGANGFVRGSVLDRPLMEQLFRDHRPTHVFHLAAVLSARAEQDPQLAHRVNVEGTVSLMELARRTATELGHDVAFLFPSSIAVYGLPDARAKADAGAVREAEWNVPAGIYGCNKLYCEMLGSALTRGDLAAGRPGIDFRAIRFPGLISAESVPSGGTSDYGPAMIHAAASGKAYTSFVGPQSRLPFMTMTDAVEGFLTLAEAPADRLTRRVYNIKGFSPTAQEIRDRVVELFPDARIGFEPDPVRQALVDTWPGDVDDTPAREDWGFAPRHGLESALRDYLLPALRTRYGSARV